MLIGANPAELRNLARDFGNRASQVGGAVETIGARLWQTGWAGPDAEAFKARWTSELRPKLLDVRGALEAICTALQRQADEQEQASLAGPASGVASAGNWRGIGGALPSWRPSLLLGADLGLDQLDLLVGPLSVLDSALETSNLVSFWRDGWPEVNVPYLGEVVDAAQIYAAVDEYGWGDARTWRELVDGGVGTALDALVPIPGVDQLWSYSMDAGWALGDTAFFEASEDVLFDEISSNYDLSTPAGAAEFTQKMENPWELTKATASALWPF